MRAAVGVLAVGLLALGIARNAWPWIVDDAFISLRFAERLVDGDGLTWTDGERVEGYSNLLWVLLTALLGWLGCDWILAVRLLGITCTVGTFAILLGSELLPSSLPARLSVCLLAALAATSVWAVGGLESPLLMLLVTAAMAGMHAGLRPDRERWRRPLLLAGLALALACWTRPDGPLWAAAAGAMALFFGGSGAAAGGSRWQRLGWLIAPPIAAVLLQLGFRLAYYSDWLPNTGRAKVTTGAEGRRVGWTYVESAAVAMRALLVPATLGTLALIRRRTRPLLMFAAAGTIAWWLYVLQMGGDSFPRSRLLVPSLGPLTVLAAHGLDLIAARGRIGVWLAGAIAVAGIVVARIDAVRDTGDPRQQLSVWEWPAIATGEWLARAFAEQQPLVAVDAAGAVPFASRLPCLDMLGLCDRTIATTPVPPDQAFVPGHARANGAYVLAQKPDLVMFGLPPGSPQPQWLGGWQMESSPAFRRDYRLMLFETGDLRLRDGTTRNQRLTVWARLEGRIGVSREDGAVRVPGYWVGTWLQNYSYAAAARSGVDAAGLARDIQAAADWWLAAAVVGQIGERGAVVGEVRRAGEHRLRGLPLAVGLHRLSAERLPAGVTLSLRANDASTVRRLGDSFEVMPIDDRACSVDVVCAVPATVELPFTVASILIEPVR